MGCRPCCSSSAMGPLAGGEDRVGPGLSQAAPSLQGAGGWMGTSCRPLIERHDLDLWSPSVGQDPSEGGAGGAGGGAGKAGL